jgi:hypothetical protein
MSDESCLDELKLSRGVACEVRRSGGISLRMERPFFSRCFWGILTLHISVFGGALSVLYYSTWHGALRRFCRRVVLVQPGILMCRLRIVSVVLLHIRKVHQ